MGYYDSHIKTVANNIELAINRGETPHFPDEGLCIGSLNLPNVQLPARSKEISLDDLIDELARRDEVYTSKNEFAHHLHPIARRYEEYNY